MDNREGDEFLFDIDCQKEMVNGYKNQPENVFGFVIDWEIVKYARLIQPHSGERYVKLEVEKKTSQKWQEQFPNPNVLDPDGWNRSNFQYSWFEEEISEVEYQMRLMRSTCIHVNK